MVSETWITLLFLLVGVPKTYELCPSLTASTNEYLILPKSYRHRAERRGYRIYVPTRYDRNTRTPLVLFLHGNGGSAARAAENTRFVAKSDAEGFIVAFPEGIKNKDIGMHLTRNAGHSWNAGMCCSTAAAQNANDVLYIKEVLDDIQSK